MNLRHRPMQPEDIPEYVGIVSSHPVIGARYGPAIQHLPEALRYLLLCEAKAATVVYAEEGSHARFCFCGITAFVRDDFLHDLKTPPHFWVGPELTRRIGRGQSPVLTGKELRAANSSGGMNLVCWDCCIPSQYEAVSEIHRYMMAGFIREHRGYLWKEVISAQSWTADHLEFVVKAGGLLWDPRAGGYTSCLLEDPGEIVRKPHIVGITRELEFEGLRNWAGSWVGAVFDYQAPVLGFSPSEQKLLYSALAGATDELLSAKLGTSLPVVKKVWVSIYERVEDRLPELILTGLAANTPVSGRGREKRRRLLTYLREHPEELRPASRRLLAMTAPARGPVNPPGRSQRGPFVANGWTPA